MSLRCASGPTNFRPACPIAAMGWALLFISSACTPEQKVLRAIDVYVENVPLGDVVLAELAGIKIAASGRVTEKVEFPFRNVPEGRKLLSLRGGIDDDGDGVPDRCTWKHDSEVAVFEFAPGTGSALTSINVKEMIPTCPTRDTNYEMVQIIGAKFLMGSPPEEIAWANKTSNCDDCYSDEGPQVQVEVAPFLLGSIEVSNDMWMRVMGSSPSRAEASVTNIWATTDERFMWISLSGPDLPVQNVSWTDAIRFCNALSAAEGLSNAYEVGTGITRVSGADGYRLPTEAEFESVARAKGTGWPDELFRRWGPAGNDRAEMCSYANVLDQSVTRIRPELVAFPCNDSYLGPHPVEGHDSGWYSQQHGGTVYDLIGNVAEWVWDPYAKRHGAAEDGERRAIRGGSFASGPTEARPRYREGQLQSYRSEHVGLRVARTLGGAKAAGAEQ